MPDMREEVEMVRSMTPDEVIASLLNMKRYVYTDDLATTIRVAEEHNAIDHAILFIKNAQRDSEIPLFGRWKQIPAGMTPGGTPAFVCAACGGTDHLYGAEYPYRKVLCNVCGRINFYPWEKIYDPIVPEEIENA